MEGDVGGSMKEWVRERPNGIRERRWEVCEELKNREENEGNLLLLVKRGYGMRKTMEGQIGGNVER